MSTVLFHRMKLSAHERTPIQIIHSEKQTFCHGCNRTVRPDVIITAFLSLPLTKCPLCHSVLQNTNGNGNAPQIAGQSGEG